MSNAKSIATIAKSLVRGLKRFARKAISDNGVAQKLARINFGSGGLLAAGSWLHAALAVEDALNEVERMFPANSKGLETQYILTGW
ncbi:hypothetical protein [Methylomonas sp. TEB]|uniref:hypothetical protein n=1 Tax=Methylomonas sp. TEB TaxID=3398229 RepID=UPI0039F4756F